MITIGIILSLIYSLALLHASYLWQKESKKSINSNIENDGVTIIIPFRNEANNLYSLLNGLLNQNHKKIEILLINDHSTDNYHKELEQIQSENWSVLNLEKGEGKKAAIDFGISKAKYNHILLSDADCTHGHNWVESMLSQAIKNDLDWLGGPVNYKTETKFSSFFQSLESAYLVLLSGWLIKLRKPATSNGANIYLKKSTFLEIDGFKGLLKTPSGDDELLMQKMKKYKKELSYCFSSDAIVTTSPSENWNQMINQRRRWASKLKYNLNYTNWIVAGLVFFFHGFIILTIIYNPIVGVSLILARFLTEYYAANWLFKFFRNDFNLGYFLISFLLYPLYAIFMAAITQIGHFKWKDRSY